MNVSERFAKLSPNQQSLLALWLERRIKEAPPEDQAGADRRLVAYVVLKPGLAEPVGELREHLKRQVPDYMLPDAFIALDALPLTPNGKIDRRQLAAAPSVHAQRDDFVAPRTELEEELAGLWAEVLGVERVSVNDNFFDLGGHSLLATRLMFKVRELFDVELPLRVLFEAPTLAGFAVAIVQRQVEQIDGEEMARILADLERP
jgi:acyl carrier protein